MPSAALDATARLPVLDRLERERFDLAVIGGGITGAGIAREAALRGLSVALFEARDFGSGTSSKSTKLIHGGLRYLAMGDVALVRSSALERKVIHRLAPHLAEPRWLVVPARSRLEMMKLRAGITTYEKLGAVERRDLHRNWDADDLAREEPLFDREAFPRAVAYREYLTHDARLVIANLRAAAGAGAAILNRARVDALFEEDGRAAGVEVHAEPEDRKLRVRARCVVNAAGPWVDAVRRFEDPEADTRLHLSKGVHIVLPHARLPLRHMLLLGTEDGRSIFVIPTGSSVYVGTTDTTYEPGAAHWPEITQQDVAYLLAPLARHFRIDPIEPREIAAAWAGLRPLIAEPGKGPSEISRKDEVWIGPKGVITIAGGKLTGFRPMAQDTLARAAEVCGLEPDPAPEQAQEPRLPGGDFEDGLETLAEGVAREAGVPPATAARLVRLYGSEAARVCERGAEPLAPDARVVRGEVDWAVCMEGATTLRDVLYRRTAVALYEPDLRNTLVEPTANRMATLLGWSPDRTSREISEARSQLTADLTFT